MDMNQYMDIFIEESKEHLQDLNQLLLDIEKEPNDSGKLNEIFRIAHTLKGMSSTMGFNKLSRLTHEMENVLQLIRNKEINIDNNIIDVLFECFDTLEAFIDNISKTGSEGDNESKELVEKLMSISNPQQNTSNIVNKSTHHNDKISIETEEYTDNVITKASEAGFNSYKIKVILNPGCMLKSARAFIVFNTLEKYGEIIKSKPGPEEIEDENFENFFELIYISKLDEKSIKNEILRISEIEDILITEIESKKHDTIELNDSGNGDDEKILLEDKNSSKTNKNNKTSKTVRVDIDRLDNLMNLVSELIIIKTRLEDVSNKGENQSMNETIEYLERITTSLHDAVMKVRMVPVERVFNRFPRMVRDLSKELGKEVVLNMTGIETEVDRTVIDEIGDPLIHLIRNSIDHGIEDPKTRIKLNKPEYGSLSLKAYHDGNNVVIEVEDDGKGLDFEKIKETAISKKLISKEDLSSLKEQDLINLLFTPGFSTAKKISDVSGRGVGLDVVKTKIESLGGIVEVQTEKGKGSKFVIRLPLTLAIIQALMVEIGDEKYALPLNSIKEITIINAKNIQKIQDNEVVLYRNKTLPIIRMDKVLQTHVSNRDTEDLIMVVVRKGEKMAGLIVQDLIGQQEIVIKSLGKYLSGIKVIAGATILGNGQIALIVDPNSLF